MIDDLISRQAAIDALDEQIKQCDKALSSFDISLRDEFAVKVERASLCVYRETLEQLPPAPEREIVRCKDCREFRRYIDTDITFCDLTEMEVKECDFCSRAKKMEVID